MVRNIVFFLGLFILLSSCQHTNDYYSDINNSNKEKVDVNLGDYDLSISALKYDDNLEISLYVITEKKRKAIDNIDVIINGLNDLKPKRKFVFCDSTKPLNFNNFHEVKNVINNVKNKKCFIIHYTFKNSKVLTVEDLDLNVYLNTNTDIFNEKIKLKKHRRYKFW